MSRVVDGQCAETGSGAPDAGASELPPVSVIIPARNAERTISATLDAVLAQDYRGPIEVVVADGSESPETSDLVRERYPAVRLVANPGRTMPNGLNAALATATGRIVVRCDAHAVFPPGYVRRAVATLARTGAANVGGRQLPVGTTIFERAVAMALVTALGSGGARYRVGGGEGPTDDIVYLGVFRRETLDAVGGYDARQVRNSDAELNWRLQKRGLTVWFDPELATAYRPRGTLRSLARQYLDYGRWKRVMARQHPSSIRFRHLASPLLVLGLAASALSLPLGAFRPVAAALPLAYVLALTAAAANSAVRCRDAAAVLLPIVLATMHLSWGVGFLLPPPRGGSR